MMGGVKAEGLSKSYGTTMALKNATFDIPEGELFGFIGPDGAGKTTLFRILTTLILPDTGDATVAGYPIKEYREIRKIVGYMPGRFSLYSDLSVVENLTFFATIYGTTIEEQYDLIKDIYRQLEPFKKRRASALSGGMKQKLALCCALVHDPEVLVLDEPTTGVDPVSRKEFWDILYKLRERGMTIIVSTPYMDEANRCDRIALMQDGILFTIDTPEAIAERFDRELLAVYGDRLYDMLNAIREYPYTNSIYTFGDCLHFTDKRGSVHMKELQQYLHSKGFKDASLIIIKPAIEDTFMSLIENKD